MLSDELFHAKRLAYVLPPLAGLGTSGSKLVDCAEWTASPDAAKNALDERGGQALALYGLPALCTGDGAAALERLVEAACDPSVFWVLILCGSREEVDALFRRAPRAVRMLCRKRTAGSASVVRRRAGASVAGLPEGHAFPLEPRG